MPLDLNNKKWPKKVDRSRKAWKTFNWDIWRKYSVGVFVCEGCMYAKELSFYGMTRAIPAEESAITSLCLGVNYQVFGATSGKHAHLFRYQPKGPDGVVIDIGSIGNEKAVRKSLVSTSDGIVIGGTSSLNDSKYDGGKIFEYRGGLFSGDFIQEWQIMEQKVHIVTIPVKGEGIGGLVIDNVRNRVYGISDKTGVFFIYDFKKKKIKKIGDIDKRGFSTAITIDSSGKVFGCGYGSSMFYFDPDSLKIEKLNVFIPTFPGRNLYDSLDSLTYDKRNSIIYGGTKEGNLFVFNPATKEIKSLGKPTNLNRIRDITVTNDGRVFGISGEDNDMNHLFCYNPKNGELKDLGIPLATMEKRWYGYKFDCVLTGVDGEIYLGESDRISHLFIYHPNIL